MGVPDQGLGGAHQARRVGIALRRIAVAVGHQVGRGQQRQLLEAAVASDRVEVGREPVVALLLEQITQRELEANGVDVRGVWQRGVDLEPAAVL